MTTRSKHPEGHGCARWVVKDEVAAAASVELAEVQYTPKKVTKSKKAAAAAAQDGGARRIPLRLDPTADKAAIKDERFSWWPKDTHGDFVRPGDGKVFTKEEMDAGAAGDLETVMQVDGAEGTTEVVSGEMQMEQEEEQAEEEDEDEEVGQSAEADNQEIAAEEEEEDEDEAEAEGSAASEGIVGGGDAMQVETGSN